MASFNSHVKHMWSGDECEKAQTHQINYNNNKLKFCALNYLEVWEASLSSGFVN